MPTPQARRRRQILGTLAGIGIGVVIVLMMAMLIQTWTLASAVRDTQLEGTPLGKKLLKQADTIESCTSTEGACAKRNRKATTASIADINKITLYAAACADQTGQQTVEEIQSCVITKLAAEDRKNP